MCSFARIKSQLCRMVMWRYEGRSSHLWLNELCCWVSWETGRQTNRPNKMIFLRIFFLTCGCLVWFLVCHIHIHINSVLVVKTLCIIAALSGSSKEKEKVEHLMRGRRRPGQTMAPLKSKVGSPRCLQVVIKGHGNPGQTCLSHTALPPTEISVTSL